MSADLSILGLGTMGGRVAARAAACGLDVVGFDPVRHACERASSAGVKVVASADECAALSDRVLLSVPRPEDVDGLVGGRGNDVGPGTFVETVAGSGAATASNLFRELAPRVVGGHTSRPSRSACSRRSGTTAPTAQAVSTINEAVRPGRGPQGSGPGAAHVRRTTVRCGR